MEAVTRILQTFQRSKVVAGKVHTPPGYYLVTLTLECGHSLVQRLTRVSRYGMSTSINRNKADRMARAKVAQCPACGPEGT